MSKSRHQATPRPETGINPDHKARAWSIFVICSLGFAFSSFYRLSVTVIAPQLSVDLGLGSADLSLVSAVFFYVFAAVQIPLGMTLDRVGIRVPVTLLMSVGALGSVVFALAQSMSQAVCGRALMGLGMSAAMMGPFNLAANWFPPTRFAFMAGMMVTIGSFGQLMAATPLALMAQSFGWRNSFLAVAVLNLLQAAAFFVVARDRPPGTPKPPPLKGNPFKGLAWLVKRPSFWAIGLTALLRYGAYMALAGLWAGPFLMNALGYSQIAAGNALLGLNLGFLICPAVLGRISDNWLESRKRAIWPTIPIAILIILSLNYWPRGFNVIWVCIILFLYGFCTGGLSVHFAHIKELTPAQYRATGFTGVNLFLMTGPAVMIQVTGFMVAGDPAKLTDPAGFVNAWYLLAGGLVLAGVLYALCPDSRAGSETPICGPEKEEIGAGV